jgi:hypothetical protein
VISCEEDKKIKANGKRELVIISSLAVYVVDMAVNMKSFVFGCHAVSPGTELPMGFEESSNGFFREEETNTLKTDAAASYETLAKLRHTKRRPILKDSNYLA